MNVNVTGPEILFKFKLPFSLPLLGDTVLITETIVNSWIIMAVITLLCFLLTRKLSVRNPGKVQLAVEKLISMLNNLVENTMGKHNMHFAPYIGTLFTFSALGSLSSLTGLRPITGDLNTTLGWALVTFMMIQICNIRRRGVFGWLKGFTEPVILLTPLNLVSEIANPISMAFRHFGNIASGIVISGLIYGALAALSQALLGWLPVLGTIPLFQAGIPAFLSLYFDVWTGFLQAYIISMLTMVFVGSANEPAEQ